MISSLLFASHNLHKFREIRAIADPVVRLISLQDLDDYEEIPETGATLEQNAVLKAATGFARHNIPCFADDSGLECDALNGAPGVYSARYAGPQQKDSDNLELLLQHLSEKPVRTAQFRTVIAFVDDTGQRLFEGTVRGRIARETRGQNGFGYDPVFVPDGYDLTFAEMSGDQKNALSHRSKAVWKFMRFLHDHKGV